MEFSVTPKPHVALTRDEIALFSSELLVLLEEGGILINSPDEDDALLYKVLSGHKKFDICNLRFLISLDCNMDCSYCQIERNLSSADFNKNMSANTVITALSLFESLCDTDNKLTINFTGGEPLLNFDKIRSSVQLIKSSDVLKNSRLVVFTNGTLLNQERAEFFRDNNFLVIVSLDGADDIHGPRRKFRNGKSTYQQALHGYLLAQKIGCNCSISAVADLNIANINDWLSWLISLKPLSVGLNYQHQLLNNEAIEVDFNAYTNLVLTANEALNKNGILLENYERFSKPYNDGTIRWRECQACGRGITVDSSGNIGPCKSLLVSKKIAFPLSSFNPIYNECFNAWAERTPLKHEVCLGCPAISICGGGCAYDAYCIHDGDALKMDKRMCEHVKSIFCDILRKKIATASNQPLESNNPLKDTRILDTVGH